MLYSISSTLVKEEGGEELWLSHTKVDNQGRSAHSWPLALLEELRLRKRIEQRRDACSRNGQASRLYYTQAEQKEHDSISNNAARWLLQPF
jgi:hypothetical protein